MKYPHIIANIGLEKTSDAPRLYDVVNVTRRAIARRGYLREALAFADEALDAASAAIEAVPASVPHHTRDRYDAGVRAALGVARRWCNVLVPSHWSL